MSDPSAKTFTDLLKRSNLLSAEQLAVAKEAIRADLDSRPSAVAVARTLVKHKLLTRWQAQQLLAGRHTFFLAKYKLQDKLGEGGMGTVFKAVHRTNGRVVALKVLSNRFSRKHEWVHRFLREVRAAAALNHPNIVAAYDADQIGGTYYLVMEYVEGRDLREWLKQYPRLPLDWACEVIRQAAVGLQHAYERGLVHRDIKPANLLVLPGLPGQPPKVKLLDMGLARLTDQDAAEDSSELTRSGQVLGTPEYMAPEQARSTKTVDIRADIFSLGCTLFKMLTGELPFDGGNAFEKLMARTTHDAYPLSEFLLDAPARLEAVVAKMLARDADRRYQTPDEVVDALAPFAMSTAAQWNEDSDIDLPSVTTESDSLSPTDDSTLREFISNMHSASEDADSLADLRRRHEAGENSATIDMLPRWNIVEARWFMPAVCGGGLTLCMALVAGWWAIAGSENAPLAPSPTVETFEEDSGVPPVWPVVENNPEVPGKTTVKPATPTKAASKHRRIKAHAGAVGEVRFSANGRYAVTFGVDRFVNIWDADTLERLYRLDRTVEQPAALAFRGDSVEVAVGYSNGVVRLWPIGQDAPRFTLKEHTQPIVELAYTNDGRLLASADAGGELRVWGVATASQRWSASHNQPITAMDVNQFQSLVATGHPDGSVVLWDLESGEKRQVIPAQTGLVSAVVFSTLGDQLAVSAAGDAATLWSLASPNAAESPGGTSASAAQFGPPKKVGELLSKYPITGFAYAPNGKWIVAAARGLPVYDSVTGRQVGSLTTGETHRASVAFTTDGRQLASTTDEGYLWLAPFPQSFPEPKPSKTAPSP